MTATVHRQHDAVSGVREKFLESIHQSERKLLLGTVMLLSTVSLASGIVLTQYWGGDVLSSLLYVPQDCWFEWIGPGRHCFADYSSQVTSAMRPNPWAHVGPANFPQNPYPAAAMAPFLAFGLLGRWLESPQLAMFVYVVAMAVAVLTPAMWASRGARGLERLAIFVACGAAAIPAWAAVDRGNSAGFLAPIMLIFLVALLRQQWGRVALMVVLAALLKPQFAVLVVVLFAARKWRLSAASIAGMVMPNLVAYLLWPQDFPETIAQSIHNTQGYGYFYQQTSYPNISFAKVLLQIPDQLKALQAGAVPEGFLAGPRAMIGYGILALVVVAIVALGRRLPPVMAGTVLLATASFFPAVTYRYYLVFVLPIAALVVRNPDGPPGAGLFDRLGDRRRAIGVCVSLASALSIAHVVLPGPPNPVVIPVRPGDLEHFNIVTLYDTTAALTPLWWVITCIVIIVSYARRPATTSETPSPEVAADAGATVASPEPVTVANLGAIDETRTVGASMRAFVARVFLSNRTLPRRLVH